MSCRHLSANSDGDGSGSGSSMRVEPASSDYQSSSPPSVTFTASSVNGAMGGSDPQDPAALLSGAGGGFVDSPMASERTPSWPLTEPCPFAAPPMMRSECCRAGGGGDGLQGGLEPGAIAECVCWYGMGGSCGGCFEGQCAYELEQLYSQQQRQGHSHMQHQHQHQHQRQGQHQHQQYPPQASQPFPAALDYGQSTSRTRRSQGQGLSSHHGLGHASAGGNPSLASNYGHFSSPGGYGTLSLGPAASITANVFNNNGLDASGGSRTYSSASGLSAAPEDASMADTAYAGTLHDHHHQEGEGGAWWDAGGDDTSSMSGGSGGGGGGIL